MCTLVVCSDFDKWRERNLPAFLAGVFEQGKALKGVRNIIVVLTGYEEDLAQLEFGKYADRVVTVPIPPNAEWGLVYPFGYKKALTLGADIILEIDMGGTHKPEEIPHIVEPLLQDLARCPEALVAVFSTRSAGGKNFYPVTRQVTSWVGTQLAKFFLLGSKGKDLSDLTSGFQAFSREAIEKIFEWIPPEEMVTPQLGPFYLWQTEIRMLAVLLGVKVYQIPITYGEGVQGYPLSPKVYLKAARGFLLLVWRRFRGSYSNTMG